MISPDTPCARCGLPRTAIEIERGYVRHGGVGYPDCQSEHMDEQRAAREAQAGSRPVPGSIVVHQGGSAPDVLTSNPFAGLASLVPSTA